MEGVACSSTEEALRYVPERPRPAPGGRRRRRRTPGRGRRHRRGMDRRHTREEAAVGRRKEADADHEDDADVVRERARRHLAHRQGTAEEDRQLEKQKAEAAKE